MKNTIYIDRVSLERVRDKDGAGYHNELVRYKVGIDVNFEKIAEHLGPKAFRNKSKKTHLCHGAIKVAAYTL